MKKVNGQWSMVNSKKSDGKCLMTGKKIQNLYLFFTFYFLLFTFSSFSQTTSASLDRDKILIGEQVILQLKADVDEAGYSMSSWFDFPDTINHLEIVSRGKIDTIENGGTLSYTQTLTLTSFDSGLWKLPKLQIVLLNKTNKQTVFKADSLSLQVIPVDVSSMKDYHDIKTIIDVQADDNTWMYIAIIAASVFIIAIILWLIFRKKKKKIFPVKKSVIKGSPLEWIMEQLALLEKENYPEKNETKTFYTKLDEIYRTYIDEQIYTDAKHLTADELMLRLKVYLSKENVRTNFFQTMRLINAVKFAKYLPDNLQNKEALKTTREMAEYIDETTAHMKKQNAY